MDKRNTPMFENLDKQAQEVARKFINEGNTAKALEVLVEGNQEIITELFKEKGIKFTKGVDTMSSNKAPKYDFSSEYLQKELDLGEFMGHPFIVTVQEIPHGKYVNLQRDFIGTISVPKDKADQERIFNEKQVDPISYADGNFLAGIASWTLKLRDGTDVPVSQEAWEALPHRITEQIEKGIKSLNPTMEDDFRKELLGIQAEDGIPSKEAQES